MQKLDYINWLKRSKDTLLALYRDYQAETGDTDTSLDEFCATLYTETVHARGVQ